MMRDRHGRILHRVAPSWRASTHFEDLVREGLQSLEPSWGAALRSVEFAVADLPDIDNAESITLAETFPADAEHPARVVLYRHPITIRCVDLADAQTLILDLLIEQISEIVGVDPEDIDERYGQSG